MLKLSQLRRELLNRKTTPERLEELHQLNREQFRAHGISVGLALHPRSPSALREAVLPELFWRDLIKLIGSPDVPDRTRSAALPILRKRTERISLGEWQSLAAICPPRLFDWVLKRGDERIFTALLQNPRMTRDTLMKLVHGAAMSPSFAVAIERTPRWFTDQGIRKSLIYCAKGNLSTALSALRGLTRTDLSEIARTGSLHPLIQRTASVLLENPDQDNHHHGERQD